MPVITLPIPLDPATENVWGGPLNAAINSVNSAVDSITAAALLKANNLSDLPSPSTARTSLGLGTAATKAVGTTAGTVAAGDDSRFTDSRAPSGSAGGDLTGSYPNPTLAVARALASRQVIAGTGLTGGGDLTADRTLTVAYGTTSGTAAQGNDSRITGAAPLIELVNVGGNSGASATIPDVTTATMHTYTLNNATVTFTMPTAAAGKSLSVELTQDGGGSKVPTFTGVRWPGGTMPAASTAASAIDIYAFACFNGTNWEGVQPAKGLA